MVYLWGGPIPRGWNPAAIKAKEWGAVMPGSEVSLKGGGGSVFMFVCACVCVLKAGWKPGQTLLRLRVATASKGKQERGSLWRSHREGPISCSCMCQSSHRALILRRAVTAGVNFHWWEHLCIVIMVLFFSFSFKFMPENSLGITGSFVKSLLFATKGLRWSWDRVKVLCSIMVAKIRGEEKLGAQILGEAPTAGLPSKCRVETPASFAVTTGAPL